MIFIITTVIFFLLALGQFILFIRRNGSDRECLAILNRALQKSGADTTGAVSLNGAAVLTERALSTAFPAVPENDIPDETAAAMELIRTNALTVKTGFNEILEGAAEVGKMTEEKMRVVQDAAETARDIVTAVEQITGRMDEHAVSFRDTIPKLREFIDNTGRLREQSLKTRNRSEKLVEELTEGDRTIRKTVDSIGSINEAAADVKASLVQISSIAEQTNILAMNAAIQAAHAGAAGKGFAVVASEVRKLASDTGATVDSVRKQIEEMAARIEAGRQLSDRTMAIFSDITGGIRDSDSLIRNIDSGLSGQMGEAESMIPEIESLAGRIREIQESAGRERGKTDRIGKAMEQIASTSERIQTAEQELIRKDYEILEVIDRLIADTE